MSRTFEVQQSSTVYRTITWQVEANSFDEAQQMVIDGYGDIYDTCDDDEDYGDIEEVLCIDCGETESDDCECVDTEFMADIGLA